MSEITIVGLGPGSLEQMSLGAWNAISQADSLVLRTALHPTATEIKAKGVSFASFDAIYERAETFDEVYEQIVAEILAMSGKSSVTYAVPGHPFVGESTVPRLLERARAEGITTRVIPSMSALDAIYDAAEIDPVEGLQIIDALQFQVANYLPQRPALFIQVYNSLAASQVKLELMEAVTPETEVTVIRAAGVTEEERLERVPLYELDRLAWLDHLTSVYVPAGEKLADSSAGENELSLRPLVEVMDQLLGEDGCPWDRKQTHESLKRYLIEESYEVIDAVDDGDFAGMCEELGDVLLQIVFHAALAEEEGQFNIDDVVAGITEKMIRRHPHVFADVTADDVNTVLSNWEQIKREEKAEKGNDEAEKSALSGVPRHLPALMLAEQIQKKAAKVGFEWDEVSGALAKVEEELAEMKEACQDNPEACIDEMGDVFFALVNVARYRKVDPEAALRATVTKFQRRFEYIEAQARKEGRTLATMTLAEMDKYWDEAKLLERH